MLVALSRNPKPAPQRSTPRPLNFINYKFDDVCGATTTLASRAGWLMHHFPQSPHELRQQC